MVHVARSTWYVRPGTGVEQSGRRGAPRAYRSAAISAFRSGLTGRFAAGARRVDDGRMEKGNQGLERHSMCAAPLRESASESPAVAGAHEVADT